MIKKLTQRYIKANFPPELVGAESGGALLCNPDEESYMGPNFSAQIFRELSDRQNAGQLSDGQIVPEQRNPEAGRKGERVATARDRYIACVERVAFKHHQKTGMAAGRHPMDRTRGHQLLPRGVANKIPKLYSQDGKGEETMAYGKFFSPYSQATWYITEFDGNDRMFGWVDLGRGGEFGYISLSELQQANRNGLPLVERDMYWSPKLLSKAKGE